MDAPRIATMLGDLSPKQLGTLLASLSVEESQAMLDDWQLWAMAHQRMPPGEWRRWLIRAGRGSGKTHGAAKSCHDIARDRSKVKTGEIGIISRTYSDTRLTCVEAASGLLATAPSDFRPIWHPGPPGVLIWPNGVRGRCFSADRPDGIRGANLAYVWADEIATWPNAKAVWWEVIEPALRIGFARSVITSTPKPNSMLKELEDLPGTVTTRASMFDNAWLSAEAKAELLAHYEGRPEGLQELYGEYVEANEEALWQLTEISQYRVDTPPTLKRIVIAIDPAATNTATSDETGIIAYGIGANNHGYVLADETGKYSPMGWAAKAIELYRVFQADRIVAEVNSGGEMVEATLRAVDPTIPFTSVWASRGKLTRAEPVSALAARGLIHHVGTYPKLEAQLTEWIPGNPSPDRLDALVWASTHLQLGEKTVGPLRGYMD